MPQWAMTKQDRNLTLTNDLDSLILANLLKDLFDYQINHFYSFREFLTFDKEDKRKSIGCDLALNQGYTFCNHLVMSDANGYKNKDSINLNNALNIGNDQYFKKYNLSSLVTAWSLYDIPLPKTEIGKLILLCIDSAYMGWRNPNYQYILQEWLERLQMTELIDLLNKYTQADFKKFSNINNLNAGINVIDGQLQLNKAVNLEGISEHLGFGVELPAGQLSTVMQFDYHVGITPNQLDAINNDERTAVFSAAYTYKNKISLSTFKTNIKGNN